MADHRSEISDKIGRYRVPGFGSAIPAIQRIMNSGSGDATHRESANDVGGKLNARHQRSQRVHHHLEFGHSVLPVHGSENPTGKEIRQHFD